MQLPTRIAVTLTTAITGLMALSAEVKMSHPAHVACLIAGGAILGLFVHPTEGGAFPEETPPPPVPSSISDSQL